MSKWLLLAILVSLILFLFWPGRVAGLFYYPDRISYGTPKDMGLAYQEVTFQSKDGTTLSGWFVPSVGPEHGTVIHFHGNAQNMTAHFSFVSWLPREGFNLFLFDYRGYGRSEGSPYRRGIYLDCLAALDYLSTRKDIDPNRLLVFGQSLGGAVALAAVGANEVRGIRGVAVESAFASYRGMVREKVGDIPILSLLKAPLSRVLVSDEFSPESAVGAIAPIPLLIIHGTRDPVVPHSQGKQLYEKAREPKEFWTVVGGGHTDAFTNPSSPYRGKLVEFFLRSLAGTDSPSTKSGK